MSCPCQLCFILWFSVCTTQTHRLHDNAVVVIRKMWDGQAALAASAGRVFMDDRAFDCMHNASAVFGGSVHFFQDVDVCEPSSPKATPALDDFVHAKI